MKLDINQKQNVQYCIPEWLRDEQINLAIQRIKTSIKPVFEVSNEPVAIVCFGTSLNDTWEQVKNFKTIFTGSGSHKFLIEKGLKPSDFESWKHLEVDPREHKVGLMGEPQSGIEYLISSTCHPKVFDHLEGFDVKLWHVFANQDEAMRMLPNGDWAITGGSNIGLRQMTIARFLGYTNLHVFGMDGCFGEDMKSHAAHHPNTPPTAMPVEYAGRTFYTTPAMLECAKQTWHELDQMSDVKAVFYGDGLVQEMAKNYKPNPKGQTAIAVCKPELISKEYAELNRRLHKDVLSYGIGGGRHAGTVIKLVKGLAKDGIPPSVLDYGCGKSYLAKALPFPIAEYDPAVEGKEATPKPADLVVCTDVLEHIEPELLDFVLGDLQRCVKQIGFFVISTRLAQKSLADGRNAHLIVKDKDWWKKKLKKYFKVGQILEAKSELYVVVGVKDLHTEKFKAKKMFTT